MTKKSVTIFTSCFWRGVKNLTVPTEINETDSLAVLRLHMVVKSDKARAAKIIQFKSLWMVYLVEIHKADQTLCKLLQVGKMLRESVHRD